MGEQRDAFSPFPDGSRPVHCYQSVHVAGGQSLNWGLPRQSEINRTSLPLGVTLARHAVVYVQSRRAARELIYQATEPAHLEANGRNDALIVGIYFLGSDTFHTVGD